MKKIVLYVLMCMMLFLTSCDKFDANPYLKKIDGEKNLNNKNTNEIESICNEKDTVSFAVISDSHIKYDNLLNLVRVINNENFDFVIHCGDQTDCGLVDEFLNTKNILNKLNVPYVMVLGNHDCLGTGKKLMPNSMARRISPSWPERQNLSA